MIALVAIYLLLFYGVLKAVPFLTWLGVSSDARTTIEEVLFMLGFFGTSFLIFSGARSVLKAAERRQIDRFSDALRFAFRPTFKLFGKGVGI
ncbi:hypothetical protein [Litoreibacter halocynthiae]|uniref:hypothetical protein n=1 Tax=Litoreibacter halocynthiae TaxID=1242689 RepID=UPI00106396A2|nr:hypothetical protein [Litoreibacter halocynthiae]